MRSNAQRRGDADANGVVGVICRAAAAHLNAITVDRDRRNRTGCLSIKRRRGGGCDIVFRVSCGARKQDRCGGRSRRRQHGEGEALRRRCPGQVGWKTRTSKKNCCASTAAKGPKTVSC